MHTKEWDELLGRYVSGDLPREMRERVERHLSTCAQCRRAVEAAAWAEGRWSELREEEPSEAVWLGVVSRIRARETPARDGRARLLQLAGWCRSHWRPAVALAGVAGSLLLAVGLYSWNRGESDGKPGWVVLLDAAPTRIERTVQPLPPRSQLPDLFGAAQAVLRQTAQTSSATSDIYLPVKSQILAQQVAEIQADPLLGEQFGPLLADVEIALVELTAAAADSNPAERIRRVKELVLDKDLLARLAIARSRLRALGEQDTPPEILMAYLQPPR